MGFLRDLSFVIMPSGIKKYQSSSFDTQFATAYKAGQIAWYPWVGKQYPTSTCKVLVILESHYINWERNNIEALALPDFTRRVVAEQLFPQYRWTSSSFNNLSACLSGNAVIKREVNLLWEKVALYNFVQRPMDNPNERPNGQDFINGWKAFPTVVDILRPDVCLFAGFSAISNLSELPAGLKLSGLTPWEKEGINGTYPRPCFTIQALHHTLKGVAVKHPGSFFTVDKWRAVLQHQVPDAIKALSL